MAFVRWSEFFIQFLEFIFVNWPLCPYASCDKGWQAWDFHEDLDIYLIHSKILFVDCENLGVSQKSYENPKVLQKPCGNSWTP